ncbi:MAG: leucine-rich repeat domain-containing protein [Pirellulaceae bacterium]|nr:leucine-rich repeat domain-containing protein [Pirellulaceae bacterium]
MAVIVLLSLPLGWLGAVLERTRQQKKILERFEKNGPAVAWRSGYVVRLDVEPFSAEVLSVEDLRHVKELTGLEHLNLWYTCVTDDVLRDIGELEGLNSLHIAHTEITDARLLHLKGMTKLEELCLSGTQITDVGVSHLKGLTNLTRLYLADTQITDDGLSHLSGLADLEYLVLTGTHVTEEGIEELEKALPNCEIKHTIWIVDPTLDNPQDQP